MPSPFDFLKRDDIKYQHYEGTNGMGEKQYSQPEDLHCKLILTQGTIRARSGELLEYQGYVRYDYTLYNLRIGDILLHEDEKYVIIRITETGGMHGFPNKTKRVYFGWLI